MPLLATLSLRDMKFIVNLTEKDTKGVITINVMDGERLIPVVQIPAMPRADVFKPLTRLIALFEAHKGWAEVAGAKLLTDVNDYSVVEAARGIVKPQPEPKPAKPSPKRKSKQAAW